MKAAELIMPVERFAPLTGQEHWDNSGFSIGDPGKEVHKALIALDCTEEVIAEAIEKKCDMIITHHPLIFQGVKKISPQTFTGRIIEKAIKHDIVIYAAHTNIDKVAGGVSGLMAGKLELEEREFLTPDGFGIAGILPVPLSAAQLARTVKQKFDVEHIRASRPLEGEITRVAVCGGSGRSFIKEAMERGAQVYITGDITYHEFYCQKDFMVMDIGHYGSEYDIVRLFAKILCENFPTFAVSISEKNNNPIYYY